MAWIVAVAALALVLYWLFFSSTIRRWDLGEGNTIVTRERCDVFVAGIEGRWRAFDASARHPGDGVALPADVVGRPVLERDGTIWAATYDGVFEVEIDGGTTVQHPPLGERERLVASIDNHGLVAQDAQGVMRFRAFEGDAWEELGRGRLPIVAPSGDALAYIGRDGWEVRIWPGPVRHVANDHRDPGALFTPDGASLLVPGRPEGLWLLGLDDGQMSVMAEGNLGASRRVGTSSGYRGDPLQLVAPQWREGYLQIFQTHFGGGGRLQFSSGFVHHYDVSLSADGRYLCYAQADFDETGNAPFEEELYAFDFGPPAGQAVPFAKRRGGKPAQGPTFVGTGGTVVYVDDGDVHLLQFLDSQ